MWFNANDVPEDERDNNYAPIPEGYYEVIVSRVNDKDTQKGGKMLSVGFQVISGQHKGRWIWHNINYVNDNPDAQLIGEQTLKKICNEIGKPVIDSPEEIKDIPFTIKVKVAHNDYKNELENVFSYVKEKKEGSAAPKPRPVEEDPPSGDEPPF